MISFVNYDDAVHTLYVDRLQKLEEQKKEKEAKDKAEGKDKPKKKRRTILLPDQANRKSGEAVDDDLEGYDIDDPATDDGGYDVDDDGVDES